jgi:benzoyl-CoA reductase subunit C
VVAEDHCWGNRIFKPPLRTDIDPVEALAERYHQRPACSIRFPLSDTVDASVGEAVSAKVQAAIFYCTRGDRSQVWETPDEIRDLERHGVSSLHLQEQDYAASSQELANLIENFINEQLQFQ